MIADYLPAVTPRRAIGEIDHRLEVLAGGDEGANGSEVKRLEDERRRWEREAAKLRDARIRHVWRLFQTHARLAREHRRTLADLEAERWRQLNETKGNAA